MDNATRPQPAPSLLRQRWLLIAAIAVAIVVMTAVTYIIVRDDSGSGAEKAAQSFAHAWRDNKLADLEYDNGSGNKIATRYEAVAGDLTQFRPTVRVNSVDTDSGSATAKLVVDWPLGADQHWRYDTSVKLRKQDEEWRIRWTPTVLHPKLRDGDLINVSRTLGQRGQILDDSDEPIVAQRPVVRVGVVPQEVADADALARDLGAALAADNVDLSDLPARISKAKKDAFVEVVTLRRERYEQIKSQIYDLPGTRFQNDELPLAPTRDFARAVLGAVGPVTKEMLDKEPGKYGRNDHVGKGGVQQRYNDRLAGKPTVHITIQRGDKTPELATLSGGDGESVKLTLDQRIQTAAESALSGQPHKGSLVAIRLSDNAIVAAANGPGAASYNSAFEASVAPGSTFKMVSALGLLGAGVKPDDIVNCPKRVTVEGKSFKNDHDFELGDVPFHTDFAQSCNTAFVGLAPRLGDKGLHDAAEALGIGSEWSVGIPTNTGSVATDSGEVEQAAASFGQGKTVVSPLAMASAAAAVVNGQWRQPTLLREPTIKSAASGPTLNAAHTEQLRAMMCEVITDGTAKQLNNIPGGPVCGKTGTAEYGSESPPRSHGWFIGYQGDLAFAIFLEDAGSSAPAVDLTAAFLRTTNG